MKIKKINYLLILVASIFGIYFSITKDKELVYILKDISIVFTISALYILKKVFKLNISDKFNFVYIIFIFIAHFLGVIMNFYSKIYWFDKFAHFLSGIVSSLFAIYILKSSLKEKNIFFNILFIIAFSMLIASLWEMFEYSASIIFTVDPQRVRLTGVNDTMGDLIVAFLGSIIMSLCYLFNMSVLGNKNK